MKERIQKKYGYAGRKKLK